MAAAVAAFAVNTALAAQSFGCYFASTLKSEVTVTASIPKAAGLLRGSSSLKQLISGKVLNMIAHRAVRQSWNQRSFRRVGGIHLLRSLLLFVHDHFLLQRFSLLLLHLLEHALLQHSVKFELLKMLCDLFLLPFLFSFELVQMYDFSLLLAFLSFVVVALIELAHHQFLQEAYMVRIRFRPQRLNVDLPVRLLHFILDFNFLAHIALINQVD